VWLANGIPDLPSRDAATELKKLTSEQWERLHKDGWGPLAWAIQRRDSSRASCLPAILEATKDLPFRKMVMSELDRLADCLQRHPTKPDSFQGFEPRKFTQLVMELEAKQRQGPGGLPFPPRGMPVVHPMMPGAPWFPMGVPPPGALPGMPMMPPRPLVPPHFQMPHGGGPPGHNPGGNLSPDAFAPPDDGPGMGMAMGMGMGPGGYGEMGDRDMDRARGGERDRDKERGRDRSRDRSRDRGDVFRPRNDGPRGDGPGPRGGDRPGGSALRDSRPHRPKYDEKCRYFFSRGGCAKGNSCSFVHDDKGPDGYSGRDLRDDRGGRGGRR
jgi:hypothetical protein